MKYLAALVISFFCTTACSSEMDESTENNATILTVPSAVYDDLKREVEKLNAENGRQAKTIQNLKQEKAKLIFVERQYEDLQRTCEEGNQERGSLRKSLANTEFYLYQLEWKVIAQRAIVYYECEFDQLEIRRVKSTFQLNHTLLNDVEYDDDYDRLAELRRQRWLFYLNEPPGAFWYFNDMVSRVEKSNYTKEEFARNIAILYKRLTQAIYKEAMEIDKHIVRSLSDYQDVNSVIPLLVAQYTKTKPITRMLNELKSPQGLSSTIFNFARNSTIGYIRNSTIGYVRNSTIELKNSTIGCGGCT